MCLFCDWGPGLAGEAEIDPEAIAAERRAAQEAWARLMAEIAAADVADTARTQDRGD